MDSLTKLERVQKYKEERPEMYNKVQELINGCVGKTLIDDLTDEEWLDPSVANFNIEVGKLTNTKENS